MNKFELAKLKSHIDKLAQENYLKASKLDNVDSKTANNFYWRADGIRNVLNEIEKLGLVSEDSDWVNIHDGLPDDDSTDDYLAYSIHTEVYEKVSVSKLKQMISNSAKITHWRLCPLPPKE